MFFQPVPQIYQIILDFTKNTLEIFEDEKCGLVGDVCQLAKRSCAHERRKGKETRLPEK